MFLRVLVLINKSSPTLRERTAPKVTEPSWAQDTHTSEGSPRAGLPLSLTTDVAMYHHQAQPAQLETSHFCASWLSKKHGFLFEGNINCTTGNTSGNIPVISRPPNTSSTYQFTALVSNLRNAFNGSTFLSTYQMPLNIDVPKLRL